MPWISRRPPSSATRSAAPWPSAWRCSPRARQQAGAARHPGRRVRADPGLRGAWEYEPSLANMRQLMELFPYDKALITDAMVQARYEASARPGAQAALRKLIPQPAAEGWTMVKGFPAAALAKIVAPTLVVHGREDRVVPPECGLLIANSIADADLHLFGRCGHWVQSEQPRRFAALVRDFLGE
ncbi:alpha/beta fold hydrolase [Pseudomonas qingdaonensis]|nr:alpha/beta fold hydrolase [Pseudomonas qingdaonensis]